MKPLARNLKMHELTFLYSVMLLLAMIPGVLAQEPVPDERPDIKNDVSLINTVTENSASFRLNVVGSDAMINGLTVGRGGGGITTNSAFGLFTLYSNTTGWYNTAMGTSALQNNTTGSGNTATGLQTLYINTSGNSNTATGYRALRNNTSGSLNTAMGNGALGFNTTGCNNTATGTNALLSNTIGFSNVAVGNNALFRNTDRSNLVAVGDSALYNNGLNATLPWLAIANTALGSKALYSNTTGSSNSGTGSSALKNNTTGTSNTATGTGALEDNTIGNYNTATGVTALRSNITGYDNTAMGVEALGSNTTGGSNTAMGVEALVTNTAGSFNTAYGKRALYDLSAGSNNVAFGAHAGSGCTSFTQGTFVGTEARPSASGFSNITGIGYNAIPNASNQVRIGNTSVASIGGNVGWTNFSDGGYKNNVEEDVAGLDFILKLRPVSYNLDVDKLAAGLGEDMWRDEDGNKAISMPDEITQKSRDEKADIRYTGFIAQEVEATVNELGVAFSGVDAPVNKSGYYGLRYADFVVPLVKAVQEQQAQIEALSPQGIDALQEELSELRQANEQLLAVEVSLREENEVLSKRQSLLEAENESIRGQVKDILSMLETLGVDMQDCCQQQTNGRNPGTSSLNQMPDKPLLEQNTPNPFHENTLIRYFLPGGTPRAQIIITDMGGAQVMLLPLEHQGAGHVIIHGGTLPSGTYVYTLTIDGRKVDSKRMVLL